MDAWIINEIEEQEEQQTELTIELPLPQYEDSFDFDKKPEKDVERGVVKINIWGDEE